MPEQTVLISIDDWDCDYFPQEEPFLTWLTPDKRKGTPYYILRDDAWCKENRLVVVESTLDQSCSFNIAASLSWVNENCPGIIGTKFVIDGKNMDTGTGLVYGGFDGHFLPYRKENFGYWYEESWGVPFGCADIRNNAGKIPVLKQIQEE